MTKIEIVTLRLAPLAFYALTIYALIYLVNVTNDPATESVAQVARVGLLGILSLVIPSALRFVFKRN